MPFGGLLIGGLAGLGSAVGGAVGGANAAGLSQQQLDLQKKALQNIQNVNTPEIQAMQLALNGYQNQGQLAPNSEQTINDQNSLMSNISTDPRMAQAQMQALQTLQQVGTGGLRPEDKAALAQIQQQVSQQANARNQSILQNMQQQGLGDSGAQLAAQLSNSQAAANTASQQGLNIGGQANQAALQAILNSGQLGGQMQAQSFGQQAQQASAQDVINQYNARNAQQVAGTNTQAQNQAQAANLANAQRLAEMNTNLGNQQQMYNKNLYQQNYQNEMQKAQAGAQATQPVAQTLGNQAANAAQSGANIGAGVGMGTGALAGAYGKVKSPDPWPTLGKDANGNPISGPVQ